MDQYEFLRELDKVLPSPDPQLAKRLIEFAEENEIVFYEEYLASLRFIARNFNQDTLASIPKMIANWLQETSVPRISEGAISAM